MEPETIRRVRNLSSYDQILVLLYILARLFVNLDRLVFHGDTARRTFRSSILLGGSTLVFQEALWHQGWGGQPDADRFVMSYAFGMIVYLISARIGLTS